MLHASFTHLAFHHNQWLLLGTPSGGSHILESVTIELCSSDASKQILILLDELNIVLKYQYLPIENVIKDLQSRPEMQHVVITGRAAKDELIEIADTVTEMKDVKHAFRVSKRKKELSYKLFQLKKL